MSLERMSMGDAVMRLVANLEEDAALDEPQNLRQRIEALDELDRFLGDGEPVEETLKQRAATLRRVLEAGNARLYEAIRRGIQRGEGARSLRAWMPGGDRVPSNAAGLRSESSYDYLDDLIAGLEKHWNEDEKFSTPYSLLRRRTLKTITVRLANFRVVVVKII